MIRSVPSLFRGRAATRLRWRSECTKFPPAAEQISRVEAPTASVLGPALARRSLSSLSGHGVGVIGPGTWSVRSARLDLFFSSEGNVSLSGLPPKRPFSTASAVEDDDAPFGCFEDLHGLHPSSRTAVTKVLGHSSMTEIQSKTFEAASSGKDVLGRARTGTGKTLAFLLPALETALSSGDEPGSNVGVLVISPTRELAIQIGEQARTLTSCHEGLTSQVMYGGSSRFEDVRRLERRLPTVLVATPGRLIDHLENTRINGMPFSRIVKSKTRVLVLDETDRLLDMGFRREVDKIIHHTPPDRQTLLFSATIPPGVRSVMADTMKPDYVTVDCIHDHDPATHTNDQVDQSHVVLPASASVTGPVEIITRMMDSDPNHKLIVFFPTANLTAFFSDLFNFGLGRPVIEIHSRKSQKYRTHASDQFRQKKRAVMFTSDVSARGVDYPDVTDVVQYGMPDGRETYIHRLGRTGRAGKRGRGLIILNETERSFLSERLDGLDVPLHEEYADLVSGPEGVPVSDRMQRVRAVLGSGKSRSFVSAAEKAYLSILGYYRGLLPQVGVDCKRSLVHMANGFAESAGLESPPEINARLAKNMGLIMVPELKVRGEQRFGRSSGGNRSHFHDMGRNRSRHGSQRNKSATYDAENYDNWGRRAKGHYTERPSRGRGYDADAFRQHKRGGPGRNERQDSEWSEWVEDRRRGW